MAKIIKLLIELFDGFTILTSFACTLTPVEETIIWHCYNSSFLQISQKIFSSFIKATDFVTFLPILLFQMSSSTKFCDFVCFWHFSKIKVRLSFLLLLFFCFTWSFDELLYFDSLTSFFLQSLVVKLLKSLLKCKQVIQLDCFPHPLLHGLLPNTLINSASWFSLVESVIIHQI